MPENAQRPGLGLEEALEQAEGILFLCSGNMVRSAFAELYALDRGLPLPVRSAGTAYRNDALFPPTREALIERGVDEVHLAGFRPTHIEDMLDEVGSNTVTFGMTHDHLAALEHRPDLAERAFLLPELIGQDVEIGDPVMGSSGFEETFNTITRCIDDLLERTRR